MRVVIFALICLFNILIVAGLEIQFTALPPPGKFFSPFQGFWHNTRSDLDRIEKLSHPTGSNGNSNIYFDERLVPHIFAPTSNELYYSQGYVTAALRLWQMDMQTTLAAGKLTEVLNFNERILEMDRYFRRTGMTYGAEKAVESIQQDSNTHQYVKAYINGVNDFISNLTYKNYPIEYKLIGYQPSKWNLLKTGLLLKLMANDLTGRSYDIEYTNAANLFGLDSFQLLYPEYLDHQEPIIPKSVYRNSTEKSTAAASNSNLPVIPPLPASQPDPAKGSNNWAIAPQKSMSGSPILCSDPHLTMNLPSIWLEMHLISPDMNVYGVSLTGAPGIVIGFNDHIAWGLTNTSIDVRDWYKVETRNNGAEYLMDGEWIPTETRIEILQQKKGAPIYDTVRYTAFGPIVYDEHFNHPENQTELALRWTAHQGSNELKALILMNRAKNYDDYMNALDHYTCPGQNFVFASKSGDIAIRSQGKFPIRRGLEGKMIQDGTKSENLWDEYIPYRENPHVRNPERGFVSSANQHPTDTAYPYPYVGLFQYFRNKRINQVLSDSTLFSVDDLKALQLDNKNLIAEQLLPIFLSTTQDLATGSKYSELLGELKQWDYFNDRELRAPSLFEAWYDTFRLNLWDEMTGAQTNMIIPPHESTIEYLLHHRNSNFFDIKRTTDKVESASDVIRLSMEEAFANWETLEEVPQWGHYKQTYIEHMARIAPFSRHIFCSGNKDIVNATGERTGPSWRMVVHLGDTTEAWGVYPGGQSGNPASTHYEDFLDDWTEGRYFRLLNQNDEAFFQSKGYPVYSLKKSAK